MMLAGSIGAGNNLHADGGLGVTPPTGARQATRHRHNWITATTRRAAFTSPEVSDTLPAAAMGTTLFKGGPPQAVSVNGP